MKRTNALAFVNYRFFKTSPKNRQKYSRAYFYISKRPRVLNLVGKGGCLWVVTSYLNPSGKRIYSLAYKLVNCEPFNVWEDLKKEFGEYGVLGNTQLSHHFPRNDITDVLMSLQFIPQKPIISPNVIGLSLMAARELSKDDIKSFKEFEDKVLHGRHVFISYSRKDRKAADQLQDILETRGHRVWRDIRSIVGGEDWKRAINRALLNSNALIALISHNSANSNSVNEEIKIAKSLKGKPGKLKRVIPLILEKGAWKSFKYLDDIQYIEGKSLREGALRISKELGKMNN